jgi:hypothetical protein
MKDDAYVYLCAFHANVDVVRILPFVNGILKIFLPLPIFYIIFFLPTIHSY